MAETKTAAYICKGCELGTRLDTAALAKVATKSGKMNLVREHDFLCSAEGAAYSSIWRGLGAAPG